MNLDNSQIHSTSDARRGCPVNGTCEDSAARRPDDAVGGSNPTPRVSIIVPCRNEANSIDAFLNSLLRQELESFSWEAVIADGMSDDGTREVLQQFSKLHPQIRVIDNPSRIVSTGLNACIRAASGDVIIRMDVHTEYKSDYVRRCVEVLGTTNAANVGGACIAVQTGYVGRAIAGAFHSSFAVGGAQWHQPEYEGPVDTVHLGCWRREVLEQIGCFDESLVRNQDDELNFRLTRTGGTIWQSPEIVSWYHPRSSLSSLFRQYFQYGFWKVAVIKKHRLPASWRHLIPGAFVLANCALLLAALAGVMVGAAPIRWLIVAGIAMDIAYAIAVLAAAGNVARKDGWTLFPLLPLVFCSYHFGYGIGFLSGIYYFSTTPRSSSCDEGVFTELTR
jgi:glycosyltransferase involved in cell wall biosynthesis